MEPCPAAAWRSVRSPSDECTAISHPYAGELVVQAPPE